MSSKDTDNEVGWYMHQSKEDADQLYMRVKALSIKDSNADVIKVLKDPTTVGNSEHRATANTRLFGIIALQIKNKSLASRLANSYDDDGHAAMKYIREAFRGDVDGSLAEATFDKYISLLSTKYHRDVEPQVVKDALSSMTTYRNELAGTDYEVSNKLHSMCMIGVVKRVSKDHQWEVRVNNIKSLSADAITVQMRLEGVLNIFAADASPKDEEPDVVSPPTSSLSAMCVHLNIPEKEAFDILYAAKGPGSQSRKSTKCPHCGIPHRGECHAKMLADGKAVPGWDSFPPARKESTEKRAEEIRAKRTAAKGKAPFTGCIDLSESLSKISALTCEAVPPDEFVIRVDTQAGADHDYHYIHDLVLFDQDTMSEMSAPIPIHGVGDGRVEATHIGEVPVVDVETGVKVTLQRCLYVPGLNHNLYSPVWAWARRHIEGAGYAHYAPCTDADRGEITFHNGFGDSAMVRLTPSQGWRVRPARVDVMPVDTSVVQRGRGPTHFDDKPMSARDLMEFELQSAMLNDPAPERLRQVHKLVDGASKVLQRANHNNTATEARMLANAPKFATKERTEPVAERPGAVTGTDIWTAPCKSTLGNKYLIGFIDVHLRHIRVYPMRNKSEAPEAMRLYVNYCKKYDVDLAGGVMWSDNEIVLNQKKSEEFLAQAGMIRGNSNEYEPWGNGHSESIFRYLPAEARKLLARSGVPDDFWDFAVLEAERVLNNTRAHTEGVSIAEAFTGERLDMNTHFKVWGCRVNVRIPLPKREGKLGEQNVVGVNFGRARSKPGWWVWTPQFGLMTSSNVTFFAKDFPFKTGEFAIRGLVSMTQSGGVGDGLDFGDGLPHLGDGGEDDDDGDDADAPSDPPDDDDDDATPRSYDGHQSDTEVDDTESESDPISNGTPDDVDTSGDSYVPSSESDPGSYIATLLADVVKNLEWRGINALAAKVHAKGKTKTRVGADGIPLPWQSLKVASNEVQQLFQAAEWKEIQGILDTGAAYEVRVKDLPDGVKVYQTLTIRNVKTNGPKKGQPKVRVCVQRGPEREDSHSPTMLMPTLRALLALGAAKRAHIKTGDFPQAYLNADQELYHVHPPKTARQYDEDGNRLAWALPKALYGGRKSGRHWYDMLRKWFRDHGFNVSEWDPCLFFKVDSDGAFHYVGVYVDDLIHVYSHEAKYAEVVAQFKKDFHGYTDLGDATEIFNAEVDVNDKFVTLTQTRYIEKLQEQFLPAGQEVYKTHTPSHPDLIKAVQRASVAEKTDLDEASHATYRSLVAAMNYAAQVCRPDVAVTVGLLSRALEKPSAELLDAAKRALRYLVTYKHLGLRWTVGGDTVLSGSSDSDWSVVKSTSGYIFLLAQAAIAYISKKQVSIALSSTEAEIMAASLAALEAIFLRGILAEMRCAQDKPTVIGVDNQGAVALARNYVSNSRTKHIERRHLKIRELVEEFRVRPEFVPTDENPADLFTKPLGRPKFEKFRRLIMNHV